MRVVVIVTVPGSPVSVTGQTADPVAPVHVALVGAAVAFDPALVTDALVNAPAVIVTVAAHPLQLLLRCVRFTVPVPVNPVPLMAVTEPSLEAKLVKNGLNSKVGMKLSERRNRGQEESGVTIPP